MSKKKYGVCAHDCPGACALEYRLEGDRLVGVRGRAQHPFTRGQICAKVARYAEVVHGERVLSPLLRDGPKGEGRFRRASWREALGLVARRFADIERQHGAESLLPVYYGGTLGVVQQKAIARLAALRGWSRLRRSLCFDIAVAGWQAGLGAMRGAHPTSIERSDLIVLWGMNPVSTHITLLPYIKRARDAGARLVVIDPLPTRSAAMADVHLALHPGSDGALACALMHVLLREGLADVDSLAAHSDFDEALQDHLSAKTPAWAAAITGLDVAQIEQLARAYGQARRPFIRLGVGMSRHFNGAVNVHAVSCLPTLVGAWSKIGGGALLGTDATFALDTRCVDGRDWQRETRIIDLAQLGLALSDPCLSPPLRGLYVCNANPVVSCPDSARVMQGLAREDLFTVVHEQRLTDTARFADVVLPATTFVEHDDLYKSYGQTTLQLGRAALLPQGEARCNHDVVNALAQAMGVDDLRFTGDSLARLDRLLRDSRLPARQQWGADWLELSDSAALPFADGFDTEDGRFHFYPAWPEARMPRLPDHWAVNARDRAGGGEAELDFLAPPPHHALNSSFSHTVTARRKHAPPRVHMHPLDAAARGIQDGDAVRLSNALAQVELSARLDATLVPGRCFCEAGHSAQDFLNGLPINALAPAAPVSPQGGPAYLDVRVRVSKVGSRGIT